MNEEQIRFVESFGLAPEFKGGGAESKCMEGACNPLYLPLDCRVVPEALLAMTDAGKIARRDGDSDGVGESERINGLPRRDEVTARSLEIPSRSELSFTSATPTDIEHSGLPRHFVPRNDDAGGIVEGGRINGLPRDLRPLAMTGLDEMTDK